MTRAPPDTDRTLPPHLEKIRTRVGIEPRKINNPTGTYGVHTYSALGFDNSLTPARFASQARIDITSLDDETVTFDLRNVDAPIANALRRILLVEVPSICIEHVFFHKNSSIMHDEMLAHRLGLIPLRVDARLMETWTEGMEKTGKNCVKFRLIAKCEFSSDAPRDGEAPPDVLYRGHKVFSSQIEYVPFEDGSQTGMFTTVPKPVHDDILLCKLRPGQDIHVELHATKNIGREHAKWSPVATAAYRMLPEVTIIKPARGEVGKLLRDTCPTGVFDIEDGEAVVKRPRECTVCRECIREEPLRSHVELTRKRDEFLFSVESTGVLPAAELVEEGLKVLQQKCDGVLEGLAKAVRRRGMSGGDSGGGNAGADGDDVDEDGDNVMTEDVGLR